MSTSTTPASAFSLEADFAKFVESRVVRRRVRGKRAHEHLYTLLPEDVQCDDSLMPPRSKKVSSRRTSRPTSKSNFPIQLSSPRLTFKSNFQIQLSSPISRFHFRVQLSSPTFKSNFPGQPSSPSFQSNFEVQFASPTFKSNDRSIDRSVYLLIYLSFFLMICFCFLHGRVPF